MGLAAPFLLRGTATERPRLAVLSTGFPVAVLCLYVAYLVFDAWQYLRFLLPAYPAVLAGVGAVLTAAVDRFRRSEVAIAAVIVITAVVAVRAWDFTRREGLFEYASRDQSYAGAVAYANRLPQNAILVSLAYSGTLHFYTGRDVLRWEVIRETDLDAALGYLRARGHPLYFIGDEGETRDFKGRFAGTRTAERFDKYFVTRAYEFVVYALTVP